MCTATARKIQRSFRLIDDNTVAVRIGSKSTRYTLAVGFAADCNGEREQVLALRSGREMLHVTVARDGSAMCHCANHFDVGECWHAELAVAILKHLDALADAKAPVEPPTPSAVPEPELPALEVADAAGQVLCRIVSAAGIWKSHGKLADLIRSKPFLLTNHEQCEALEASIAGTRIILA